MARWFEYFGSSLDFEDQSMLSWFEEFQNLD
jgi:hypothetical protein